MRDRVSRRAVYDITRNNFIRERIMEGEIILQHIRTDELIANILTKPLSPVNFKYLYEKFITVINLCNADEVADLATKK